jgi:hypothetical protein
MQAVLQVCQYAGNIEQIAYIVPVRAIEILTGILVVLFEITFYLLQKLLDLGLLLLVFC